MEQDYYQRPREKLKERGAAALSMAELLQIILGSGGPGASGAKIARQAAQLLATNGMTYQQLRDIPGVGDAKACQLLAVQEFRRRK